MWHIDGHDKLKPFGFSIHGCIDGFSRRLLWLEVASTNINAEVIAKYYLDAVKQVGGLPRKIRYYTTIELKTVWLKHYTLSLDPPLMMKMLAWDALLLADQLLTKELRLIGHNW